MKRAIISCLLLAGLLLNLAACQAAPEKEVVVSKNDGAFEQAITTDAGENGGVSTQAENGDAPNSAAAESTAFSYTDSFTSTDGKITYNINAQVDVPTVNMPIVQVRPMVTPADIIDTRKVVQQIYIDEKIQKYIVDIVFATRFPADYGLNDLKSMISFGASPRASINMALASRAYAFLRNRGYVIPEDVRAVCHDVMRHRLGLTYEAEANNITADEIISNILDKIAVP